VPTLPWQRVSPTTVIASTRNRVLELTDAELIPRLGSGERSTFDHADGRPRPISARVNRCDPQRPTRAGRSAANALEAVDVIDEHSAVDAAGQPAVEATSAGSAAVAARNAAVALGVARNGRR
jgi:hypothetical protein